MALDHSALDSLASSLDDLVRRLTDLTSDAESDDDLLMELREVERHLQTSNRRLQKVVHRMAR